VPLELSVDPVNSSVLLPLEAYLWEIPAECRNLRSRASFILVDGEKCVLHVWHGAKSSFQTKQRVLEFVDWIT